MSQSEPATADALLARIKSHQTLLAQFKQTLSVPLPSATAASSTKSTATTAPAFNPLHLLRDSASLLRAHTTKVSLMAINRPFSPRAIGSELREMVEVCAAGTMGALDAMLAAEKETSTEGPGPGPGPVWWGATMLKEARVRALHIVCEVIQLIKEIARITEAERSGGGGGGGGSGNGGERDALTSTAVVWAACDAMVELERSGLPGLMVRRAQQHRESMLDMIRELREYAEEAPAGGEDGEDRDGGEFSDEDDDFGLGAGDRLGSSPEAQAMRARLKGLLKKASTVAVLFPALVKRRLKTFPPLSAEKGPAETRARVQVADQLVAKMRAVEDAADEIAAEVYGGDEDAVGAATEKCCRLAEDAAALAELDWTGREDEFTTWSRKWREVLAQGREEPSVK